MTHLDNLRKLVGDAQFTAPLSPAKKLDVMVNTGGEWADLVTFAAGQRIVVKDSGNMYGIIGFTIANTAICVQRGLNIDPGILHVELMLDTGGILIDDFGRDDEYASWHENPGLW